MRPDLHTLAGAYALHALPDDERRRFETHLDGCEPCAQEVRGLTETAGMLGMAAAVAPPPALRRQVLAQARQVRQLPPVAARSARAPWGMRLYALAAAACLVLAVMLGVAVIRVQQQLDGERKRSERIAAVLTAPDARLRTGAVSAGGTSTVVASRELDQVVVVTSGLKALPDSRTYQAWLIGPRGAARSAGLIENNPVLASGLGDAGRLGLTIEPAGGSSRPTTRPIVLLPLR